MSETSPLLEARDLAVAAGGRSLCAGLSFLVRPGECWAIVGPNGAGKSTLLRALAGLLPLGAGAVELMGRQQG